MQSFTVGVQCLILPQLSVVPRIVWISSLCEQVFLLSCSLWRSLTETKFPVDPVSMRACADTDHLEVINETVV